MIIQQLENSSSIVNNFQIREDDETRMGLQRRVLMQDNRQLSGQMSGLHKMGLNQNSKLVLSGRIMQGNPLGISNSELAQVESYREDMIDIFSKEYSSFAARKQFYTNMITATRFSIAREFNRQKTIAMWRKWINWYETAKPDAILATDPVISKIHTSGKYRFCGRDKFGCPVLVIRMRYHVKGLATADENLRYLIFMMQKGVQMAAQSGTHQLCVIYDRRSMADSDDVSKESMKQFMPILNDNYPEALKSFYVLGANIFYRAMWAIVSLFVSKRTEDKINLLQDVALLRNHITPENLDKEYGGVLQMEQPAKFIPAVAGE